MAAVDYLSKKGYTILQRNYRFHRGEIDIVAEYRGDIVFIEVKARSSRGFGLPEDGLTPYKCRQIRKVAQGYLFEHAIDERSCRFDVIAIEYIEGAPLIRHLEDAF